MNADAVPMRGSRAAPAEDHSLQSLWLVWLALGFFLLATAVGLGWDKRWHTTHVFNTFYSAPHLFIYAMLAFTVLTVAGIMLWPAGRREFGGAAIRLPGLGWMIPGALAICAAGLGVVMLAGLLDDVWHSNFGLDETAWSFPHAMLGTGFQLTLIGLLACRLSLADRHPVGRLGWALMATLLMMFSADRVVGPLGQATPDLVRGIAAFPVLTVQPAFQHTARIYEEWNLNRTNWIFVPAAALATGMSLGLVWHFCRRRGVLLLAAALPTVMALPQEFGTARYFGLQHDARNWMPVPVLPAALGFLVARRLGAGERASWAVAGAVFGLLALAWSPHLLLVPLAIGMTVAGADVGRRMWRVVQRPTSRSVVGLAALFGIGIPALTGAVDLFLRLHTP